MVTFRRTLKTFVTVLKERKVYSQLNIVKDPSEFTFEYILEIISRLGESSENPSKIASCKNFIQSCWRKLERKLEDNRGVIDGSVISGGLTLILAASLSVILNTRT
jgi:hypothetical protein